MNPKRRVYFGIWGNQADMLDEFQQPPGVLFGRRVLIAKAEPDPTGPWYYQTFVLMEDKQGRLYLVQGQFTPDDNPKWNPQTTSAEDLRFKWVAWDEEPSRNPDFALDTEFMEALDAILTERE